MDGPALPAVRETFLVKDQRPLDGHRRSHRTVTRPVSWASFDDLPPDDSAVRRFVVDRLGMDAAVDLLARWDDLVWASNSKFGPSWSRPTCVEASAGLFQSILNANARLISI